MGKAIDLTAQRFGRLLVQGCVGSNKHGVRLWRCACDCGQQTVVQRGNLTGGNTRSCGCLKREMDSARLAEQNQKHGMTRTPTYKSWRGMLSRCNNPNDIGFTNYGARGITVCERWRKFEHFLEDVGERPSPKHSIDRIDGTRGYEPCNTRWSLPAVQANNKRNNRRISFHGRTQTVAQWAAELGADGRVLGLRIDRLGWPVERALVTPIRPTRRTKPSVAIPAGYRLHPAIMAELVRSMWR